MDLFAHRVHNAEYVNGIVRLECSIVRPNEKGEYNPDAPSHTTFSVNLPLQGFLRSLGTMRELAKKLQDDGTIKGQQGQGGQGGRPGQGGGRPPQGGQRAGRPQLDDLSEEDRSDDDGHIV